MFEMAAPIQSPAKCEVRSVIRFLNAKSERPVEIHKQIVAVYGNVMNGQNVTKWCREFSLMFTKNKGAVEVVITWFKGQAADFYDSGIQKLVPRLKKNVWTMPATMLKNKVMYRQFIISVAFVN